jgi:hypothetical protein
MYEGLKPKFFAKYKFFPDGHCNHHGQNHTHTYIYDDYNDHRDEFVGIVIDDKPMCMPSMRSISHQIDLIPRSRTLPDKAS